MVWVVVDETSRELGTLGLPWWRVNLSSWLYGLSFDLFFPLLHSSARPSPFSEEVRAWFLWGGRSSMFVPSLVVPIIILVGPWPVLLLLQPQSHFLVLSGKLFHAGCKCLDLQSKCCRILGSVGLHLDLWVEWDYVLEPRHENIFPTNGAKLMKQKSSVKWTRPDESATSPLYLKMSHKTLFRWSSVWCPPKSLRWQSQRMKISRKVLEIKATAYLCIGNCVYFFFDSMECLYMVLQHLAVMVFIVALMPLLVTPSSLVM